MRRRKAPDGEMTRTPSWMLPNIWPKARRSPVTNQSHPASMDAARIGAPLATICAAGHSSVTLLGARLSAQRRLSPSHADSASGAFSASLRRDSSRAKAEMTARASPAAAKAINSPGALSGLPLDRWRAALRAQALPQDPLGEEKERLKRLFSNRDPV